LHPKLFEKLFDLTFGQIKHLAKSAKCSGHLLVVQCIARDVDGKREVAGVHWDYDCYGGTLKKKVRPLSICLTVRYCKAG
jgi:hypothetical protein